MCCGDGSRVCVLAGDETPLLPALHYTHFIAQIWKLSLHYSLNYKLKAAIINLEGGGGIEHWNQQ